MNPSKAALLVPAAIFQDFLKPIPLQEIRSVFNCHHSSGETAHVSRQPSLQKKSLRVAHVLLCLSFPSLSGATLLTRFPLERYNKTRDLALAKHADVGLTYSVAPNLFEALIN